MFFMGVFLMKGRPFREPEKPQTLSRAVCLAKGDFDYPSTSELSH